MRNDHKMRKDLYEKKRVDVNRKLFKEKRDTQFQKAVNAIVELVEVKHVTPEQKVVRQNAPNNGLMYLILNGTFKVQSLQFNIGQRTL